MASILDLLKRLRDADVEFVLVGGLAATVHGSAVVTEDADVCAPLTEANLERILTAISPLDPSHRMTPKRLPLVQTAGELVGFKNLYLSTSAGQLDILEEVSGVGDFQAVLNASTEVTVWQGPMRVLSLDALIRSKRAMNRPKDLQVAIELEAIRSRLP